MDDTRLYLFASDVSISEQRDSSDIYLLIEARLCSTQPNGNKEGVTEAFIDSIVNNQEKYMCLPLYADQPRLLARDYRNLGHRYDKSTGSFQTQQIGSMCMFKKVADEYGFSLMGQARIPKRETEICERLAELYNMHMLNVSYEIRYAQSDVIVKGGVHYVDASDKNYQTGLCVVSVPAYPESVAQSMIAEAEAETAMDAEETKIEMETGVEKDENEGADKMTIEEAMSAIAQRDQRIAELEACVASIQADVVAADAKMMELEKAKIEKETALDQAECDKARALEDLSAAQNTVAEKIALITELEARITELELAKVELDKIKAEREAAERAEKVEKARAFAQHQGLDVEKPEIKQAIEGLDYESLVAMAMETKKDEETTVTIASFTMTQGIEMNDKYGDLLKTR